MGVQRSNRTVLAAAILVLLALPFAALGVSVLNEVLVRGHTPGSAATGGSGGVFEVFVVSAVALLLVAGIHLVAAATTWRGASSAGSPGPQVGLVGLVLGVAAIGLSLFGAPDLAPLVLPFPLMYGVVLVCLRNARAEMARRDLAAPLNGRSS